MQILLTLAVASLGGYVFSLLHVPLAWTIGAMVAAAMLVWSKPVSLPAHTRPMVMVVLGASFGVGFTPPVLAAVLSSLPTIAGAGVITVMCGLALTPLFARMAGLNLNTSYFCAVPGGIAVMPVLAERAGAEVPPVAFAQTVRMVVVVLTIPPAVALLGNPQGASAFHPEPLAVYWPGIALLLALGVGVALVLGRLKAANPWLIGPLLCSMAITVLWHAPSGFPQWMTNAAQVGMGAGLGVKLTRQFLLGSRRLALASLASSLLMVVLLSAVAMGLAALSGLPAEAVVLGLAPGGTPEMVITAATLEIAAPLVLGFHLVRMLINNLVVGPFWDLATHVAAAIRS